jgi:Putative Flp pilus-assembly TadE/G-like
MSKPAPRPLAVLNQALQRRLHSDSPTERGQALVLMTVAFLALLAFVGLVTDVGALYWNYGQLKRALDSAAVAASNEFRRGVTVDQMRAISLEMLDLQNVPLADTSLNVFICDANGDGYRDNQDSDGVAPWDGLPPLFYQICPATNPTDNNAPAARKLVWIAAKQRAPVYFLHLFGVSSVDINTNAVAEAATVDVVIVIDTSESMGFATEPQPHGATYVADCNNDRLSSVDDGSLKCRPLWDAKKAAKTLINNLYDGYDQVAIVTFDFGAKIVLPLTENLGDDDGLQDGDAYAAVDNILLHDDWPPPGEVTFRTPDANPLANFASPLNTDCQLQDPDYPTITCDPCNTPNENRSVLSTCTGCGILAAGNLLKVGGRPAGVWVIVFLSDGATNLSAFDPGTACYRDNYQFALDGLDNCDGDTTWIPSNVGSSLSGFPNGFCGGSPGERLWTVNTTTGDPFCTDGDPSTRHFGPMHPDAGGTNGPNGASYETASPPYDVEDFARDMTDQVALLRSENPSECPTFPNSLCPGTDIAIYSVFLQIGDYSEDGEQMLRYMANVGTDGDRVNDPCGATPQGKDCGQYYFVSQTSQLVPVFEDIASRIFTRITN